MKQICKNGDFILQGQSYLFNNLWGAETGSGTQCLWASAASGSPLAWGTRWNWTGPKDTIKSYAAVVWGWHWGWKIANTGLPIQLSSIQTMSTSWYFNLTQRIPGGTNVTYDMWLSEDPHHDEANPTGEIMVWLYHTGDISPIGSWQTNTILEGVEWELWAGDHPVSGWPVYSFIRRANTTAETFNLAHFFQYLLARGVSSSIYLLSVEAGVEIFTGEGRLETTHYSIEVERW